MICPECSRTAMTFAHFLLRIYPSQIRCEQCGANLTWTPKWKQVYNSSFLAALIAAFALSGLRRLLGIGQLAYIVVFVVAALIFAWVYFRSAKYAKKPA